MIREPHEYRLVFLAHPVRGDVLRNLALAEDWFRRVESTFPDVAVQSPWITACRVFDDSVEEQRRAGIQKNKACIRVCDEVWLAGESITPGMSDEAIYGASIMKPVFRVRSDERDQLYLTRYALGLPEQFSTPR